MKSYTDTEQSKKLAEILPLESADMFYHYNVGIKSYYEDVPRAIQVNNHFAFFHQDVPCWSLAALLSLLPDSIYDNTNEFSQLEFTKKSVAYIHGTTDVTKIGVLKDNLVDACVEMILKLDVLNLL